jgi:hypothetical protein
MINYNTNYKIVLLFLFIYLTAELYPTSSFIAEAYASSRGILKGTLYLNDFKDYLGYDQGIFGDKYISTHPIGNGLILTPSTLIIGIPIEFFVNTIIGKDYKTAFYISGQISFLFTTLCMFSFVLYALKKVLKLNKTLKIDEILFLFTVFHAGIIYLNFSLRETFLSSLLLFFFLNIILYFKNEKKKYIFYCSLSLILLILIREYYLTLIFIPIYISIFLNKYIKLGSFLFLSILLSISILTLYNYVLVEELSPILSMHEYFDPNGPFRDPIARKNYPTSSLIDLNQNLSIIFNKIKKSFFNIKIGLMFFYIFLFLSTILVINHIFKKKSLINIHFTILIIILFTGSFIFFHYLYRFTIPDSHLIGHRHMAPQYSVLSLLIFLNINLIKNNIINIFFKIFILFESIKNLIIIHTSLRFDMKFFLKYQKDFNINQNHYDFIFSTIKNFGCNIISDYSLITCYENIIKNKFDFFNIIFSLYFLFLIYLVFKSLNFIKNHKI